MSFDHIYITYIYIYIRIIIKRHIRHICTYIKSYHTRPYHIISCHLSTYIYNITIYIYMHINLSLSHFLRLIYFCAYLFTVSTVLMYLCVWSTSASPSGWRVPHGQNLHLPLCVSKKCRQTPQTSTWPPASVTSKSLTHSKSKRLRNRWHSDP